MTEENQLSERELEILRLVATGASNKDVANELVISVNTVKVHLRNIYSKLDVSTRTEATIQAVQLGLIPTPAQSEEIEIDEAERAALDRENERLRKNRNLLIGALVGLGIIAVVLIGLVGFNWWQQRTEVAESTVTIQALEQDRWEMRAEMILPRSNFATTVVDGVIYVVGGITEQGMTTRVDCYKVETDTWEQIADLPYALADIQTETVAGKVYVPGGRLESGEPSRQLLVYDPEENIWQEAAPLPTALSAYALTALEGKLYLFGGWNGTNFDNMVLQYDPSLDEWEELTSMPTARGFAGAGVSGGEIHVVGGENIEETLDVHEAYIPEQDKVGANPWITLAPLPEARAHFQIVSVVEIIHLIGGTGDGEENLQFFKYYSQNDEWQSFLVPVKDSWMDLGAEIVGEKIYIFGGLFDQQLTDQHRAYRAVYSVMVPVLP